MSKTIPGGQFEVADVLATVIFNLAELPVIFDRR